MAADIKRLQQIKDRAAVAGVGASPQGTFPDSDPYTLAVQAFRNALDDCGLKKSVRVPGHRRVWATRR